MAGAPSIAHRTPQSKIASADRLGTMLISILEIGPWQSFPERQAKQGPRVPLPDDVVSILEDEDDSSGKGRIRCPRCGWQPGSGDLWMCRCGHSWNTFETGGRCPSCSRQWQHTQCLVCGEWSPHQDWYG